MLTNSAVGGAAGPKVFFREAIIRALREEMERDERVFLLGQDVAQFGGPYRETAGLFERFGPRRIRNTPVAGAARAAAAGGAAPAGMRPGGSVTDLDFPPPS